MAHREIIIHHTRGKMLVYPARVYHKGRPRSLEGHTLRFAIANRDTMSRLVTIESGNGITQDDKGNFEIRLPASQSRRTVLPQDEYWYEIELWEDGDTEARHLLQEGPLHLSGSPFE